MAVAYDLSATYEVDVYDLEYRSGEASQARVYQPRGTGPFPTLLDVHGGAWHNGDRTSNALMDRALAAGGILVVAIDLRLAPAHPYPASVQDVNYGTRWLKSRAAELKGDASFIGALGSSSGGHLVELSAMRPHHAPYCALPLPSAPDADATLDFAIMRSPVTDPYERFLNAERLGRQEHVVRTREYFQPFEAVFEGNPPRVLERGDAEALPPMLIMVGADDDNVLPHVQEGFAAAYRAAGGQAEVVIYPDTGHMFEPGLQTDRAVASVRDFIARQAAQTGGA